MNTLAFLSLIALRTPRQDGFGMIRMSIAGNGLEGQTKLLTQ